MTTIIVPMTIEEELTIVPMDIEEEQNIISIEIHQDQELIPVMFASPIQIIGDVDYYDGSYDIVPSQQDQVIISEAQHTDLHRLDHGLTMCRTFISPEYR